MRIRSTFILYKEMLLAYSNYQEVIDKNYRHSKFPENEDLLSMKSRVWTNLTNLLLAIPYVSPGKYYSLESPF